MGKNSDSSSARAAYVNALLRKWIAFHRPDVLDVANAESFKKFPSLKAHTAKAIELPAALRELK